jgi:anthranilate phosphoribosyltransferase
MNYTESKAAFERLFSDQMSFEEAQGFLRDLFHRGESLDEIRAAVEVMRDHAVPLAIDEALQPKLIDIVGTGGDKSHSFNISTTVSIVVAAAGGMVAKHGNRSITSKSGSADVLEALGISLELRPKEQVRLLEETGFCFLFAQKHHPAMKHIMPVRKSLDHRTVFNILGPLTNPAGVQKHFIGVYDPELAAVMAQVLARTGSSRSMVVCGDGRLDELALSGVSHVAMTDGPHLKEFEIDPRTLGLKMAPLEALRGGEAPENARITEAILKNRATQPQRDVVLLNTAAALMTEGLAGDLQEGLERAIEAIDSGAALKKCQQIAEVSQKL